jgi:lipopolysaccharide/colanic/teichoic acid biosynthesis glycosyltransferase
VKAVLDFLGALVLVLLFGPLLLVVAVLIRLDSPGPAIFRQVRVGRGGTLFTIFKFRTMKTGTRDLSTEGMKRQQYDPYTKLGPCLRKTSLDELPQLFNVLRGEMSFIGPRPALPTQEDVNTMRAAQGADIVRPGITGLAQVNGRDDLDNVTKVNYDAEYCRTMSFGRDVTILLQTVHAVKTAQGNK